MRDAVRLEPSDRYDGFGDRTIGVIEHTVQINKNARTCSFAGIKLWSVQCRPYRRGALSCSTMCAISDTRARLINPSFIIEVSAIARDWRASWVVTHQISSQSISPEPG